MAKRVKAPRHPNRRVVSRLQREAKMQRWLYYGTIALFAILIILLGWGAYAEYVLKPRRPVAVVYGEPIPLDAYQRMVQYQRYTSDLNVRYLESQRQELAGKEGQDFLLQLIDQQIQNIQNERALIPTTVLDDMIKNVLVRQEAARRGIVVTEEEIDRELERLFGYDRNPPTPEAEPTATEASDAITETPAPTATPTMTYEEFVERSTRYLQDVQAATGFSEEDFRHLIESSLYRQKVEEALTASLPTTAEQVHARHILVKTREEAQQVLDRLAAGEAFEDLARELSTDTSSAQAGGDLGWFPRGRMVEAFEEAAFALAPGETSGIVETSFGFHIIQVLEREENRPLEAADLEANRQRFLQKWYEEHLNGEGVKRYWEPSMVPPEKPFF